MLGEDAREARRYIRGEGESSRQLRALCSLISRRAVLTSASVTKWMVCCFEASAELTATILRFVLKRAIEYPCDDLSLLLTPRTSDASMRLSSSG